MTERSLDANGRWRNKPVTFRVSPEECERIDTQVAMSGLSKQDYIAKRLMGEDVVVVPNSRVQRALQRQAVDIYHELRRIRNGSDISPRAGCAHKGVRKHLRGAGRRLLGRVGG